MGLYSVNNIFNKPAIPDINSIIESQRSIITECFEFNKDIYSEVCKYNRELSYSILENKSSEVFIKVIKIINIIIDKIIKFILEIGKKINKELNNNIDDSAILKNKKLLQDFNKSFTIRDFNYSISNAIPNIDHLDVLRNHIFIANNATIENIDSLCRSQSNNNSEGSLNNIRGKILNSKPIVSSNFSTELFKVFRSGKSEPDEVKINSSNIMNYYKIIEDHSKISVNISAEERNIINKISKIKFAINENVYDSGITSNKFELLYNEILTEVDNITRLYTIVLSYKYDSIISQYRVSKNILLTAIQIGGDTNVNS